MTVAPLFEDWERTETSDRLVDESMFKWVDRCKYFNDAREYLNKLCSGLFDKEREILLPKIKSNDHFEGALFEIVLINVLRNQGFNVEYEPNERGKTPDLLVSRGSDFKFYVEAKAIEQEKYLTNQESFRNLLIPQLDKIIRSKSFNLMLDLDGDIPPEIRGDTKSLVKEICDWVEEIENRFNNGLEFRNFTKGFLTLSPYSKQQNKDSFVADGSRGGHVHLTNRLRDSIIKKSKAYKNKLSFPLIIAINSVDRPFCDHDLMNVLYGGEILYSDEIKNSHLKPKRKKDGVWGWAEKPANKGVSAVLATSYAIHNFNRMPLIQVSNVWAQNPLPPFSKDFSFLEIEDAEIKHCTEGKLLADLLELKCPPT